MRSACASCIVRHGARGVDFPPVGEVFATLLASFTVTRAPVQACLKCLVCLCIGGHSAANAYDY